MALQTRQAKRKALNLESGPTETSEKKKRCTDTEATTKIEALEQERLHIAQQNQLKSPLLRLAAELRNKIYEEVFDVKSWTIGRESKAVTKVKNELSLLRVCRQTHTEASTFPFKTACFKFTSASSMKVFLASKTEQQRAAITSLEIHCTAYWDLNETKERALMMKDWDSEAVNGMKIIDQLPGLQKVHVTMNYWITPSSLDNPEKHKMAYSVMRALCSMIKDRSVGLTITSHFQPKVPEISYDDE